MKRLLIFLSLLAFGETVAQPVPSDSIEHLHPYWSPDGRHIAFSSSLDGNYDIFVIDLF